MNNLSSYCGLVDAKIRASDKDLPVLILFFQRHETIAEKYALSALEPSLCFMVLAS